MIRAISPALRLEPECSSSRPTIGQRFRPTFPVRNKSNQEDSLLSNLAIVHQTGS